MVERPILRRIFISLKQCFHDLMIWKHLRRCLGRLGGQVALHQFMQVHWMTSSPNTQSACSIHKAGGNLGKGTLWCNIHWKVIWKKLRLQLIHNLESKQLILRDLQIQRMCNMQLCHWNSRALVSLPLELWSTTHWRSAGVGNGPVPLHASWKSLVELVDYEWMMKSTTVLSK